MKKITNNLWLLSLLLVMACTKKQENVSESQEVLAPEIYSETVTYEADSISMKGYLAFDKNDSSIRPGILVVHEWWGHNDFARKRAEMLAEMGYIALAVDMYGDGKTAEHPDDAGAFSGAVMKDFEGAKDRFSAAMEQLKSNPFVDANNIGAIGYCFGGGIVLNMARSGMDLKGVASFHGMLGAAVTADSGTVNSKMIVFHGNADPFVPEAAVANFKTEMDAIGANYTFVGYDSAQHGFTNPDATGYGQKFSLPLKYDSAADADSWQKMQDFFKQVFGN